MIEIFKIVDEELQEAKDNEDGIWVNIINPTSEEISAFSEKFQIPIDFFQDSLDPYERSRIEIKDEIIMIILKIPVFNKRGEDVPFVTFPIGIVFTKNAVITICSEKVEILSDFLEGKVRGFSIKNEISFLLNLFSHTASLYLKYLKEISNIISYEEERLQKTMRNEELMKLLDIQKGLVYFSTALKTNEFVMKRIKNKKIIELTEKDEDFLDDILIENRQAIEMASIYTDILRDMMGAFSSIISNNLNVIMKFLTSITLILTIPALIAGIYGMNVELPLEHFPYAFAFVIGFSFVITTIMTFIFRRKGLL